MSSSLLTTERLARDASQEVPTAALATERCRRYIRPVAQEVPQRAEKAATAGLGRVGRTFGLGAAPDRRHSLAVSGSAGQRKIESLCPST